MSPSLEEIRKDARLILGPNAFYNTAESRRVIAALLAHLDGQVVAVTRESILAAVQRGQDAHMQAAMADPYGPRVKPESEYVAEEIMSLQPFCTAVQRDQITAIIRQFIIHTVRSEAIPLEWIGKVSDAILTLLLRKGTVGAVVADPDIDHEAIERIRGYIATCHHEGWSGASLNTYDVTKLLTAFDMYAQERRVIAPDADQPGVVSGAENTAGGVVGAGDEGVSK